MVRRPTAWFTIAWLCLAALLSTTCASGSGAETSTEKVVFRRFDGSEASLAEYRGRPLVVNFFASWCVPCEGEMPGFEQVHQRLGDRVAFLGLAMNDTLEDAQAIAKRTGVTWDLGLDPQGKAIRELGGVGMPTTVLVDREGKVVKARTGTLSPRQLTKLIADKLEVEA